MPDTNPVNQKSKQTDLDQNRKEVSEGELFTTNQGVGVVNTDDSLHAGSRGPTL